MMIPQHYCFITKRRRVWRASEPREECIYVKRRSESCRILRVEKCVSWFMDGRRRGLIIVSGATETMQIDSWEFLGVGTGRRRRGNRIIVVKPYTTINRVCRCVIPGFKITIKLKCKNQAYRFRIVRLRCWIRLGRLYQIALPQEVNWTSILEHEK